MRICLMVEGQEGVTWQQLLAVAQTAEEAGLEGLFRSDHYLSTRDRSLGSLDAWATVAALAAATKRLRLGTLVTPVTFRHPSELAKVVATVDHISGGRVELGLGAGWNALEHRAYGFQFPQREQRYDLLEEQLEIIHRTWTEPEVSFQGRHYRLDRNPGLPKPLQRPRPPVILGGSATPRSVELAVRFADEYNTVLAPLDARSFAELSDRRERVREACVRHGRDPATLPFSIMTAVVVGASEAEFRRRAERALRRFDQTGGDLEALLAGRSGRWVAGTPTQVVAQLRELASLGVERVYLQHLDVVDLETIELIGSAIMPAIATFPRPSIS